MSVRFDAAADRLLRTTDLLDYNSPYTWMAWVYLVSDLNTVSTFFVSGDDTVNNYDRITTTPDGVSLRLAVIVGGTLTNIDGVSLTVGIWSHLTIVRESATSIKMYLNGTLAGTNTRAITGRTAATRMEHGAYRSANTLRSDSRVAYIKAWSAALTLLEVQAEKDVAGAVRTANLYGEWKTPIGSDRVADTSGNGRNWTESGTLTDEAQPPEVPLAVSVSETITLTEAVSGVMSLLPAGIDAGETITITDTLAIALFSIITIRGSVREPG